MTKSNANPNQKMNMTQGQFQSMLTAAFQAVIAASAAGASPGGSTKGQSIPQKVQAKVAQTNRTLLAAYGVNKWGYPIEGKGRPPAGAGVLCHQQKDGRFRAPVDASGAAIGGYTKVADLRASTQASKVKPQAVTAKAPRGKSPDAPYGRKSDGSPKKRPGPPPGYGAKPKESPAGATATTPSQAASPAAAPPAPTAPTAEAIAAAIATLQAQQGQAAQTAGA